MTESKICTCPSGDGSLRWPCPKHPAVNQADVAAKLTFINGRPAMCGCQVEYSDGGGEYSDVIYVTLCAKHSGSAILDLVATNRIALTPEYEGQWHADLYLDREIPLAKVEGATPAEAVLALMSAERIDPEQESVEQAGGDERAAFEAAYQTEHAGFMGPLKLERREDGEYKSEHVGSSWRMWQARAALAQPSPVRSSLLINGYQLRAALDFIAPDGTAEQLESEACIEWRQQDADFLEAGLYAWDAEYPEEGCVLLDEEPTNSQPSPAQAEQAEAERPEVVAWSNWKEGTSSHVPFRTLEEAERSVEASEIAATQGGPYKVKRLMTVDQHDRIVGARWNRAMDLMGEHVARISEKFKAERDAALARVAELEALMQMNFGELHTARNLLSRLSVSGVNVDAILGGQLQDLVIVPADATLEMVEALKRSLTVTNRGTLLNAGHALNASIAASPFAKKAPEPVMCPRCEGEGTLRTGIDESPSTICKRCDGVGTIAAAPGKEGV
ncbi:TPA: hypothetical protein NH708_000188 [Pseudomonas aeruginosa]|nr:hypothetical protein [Pseudomonas aeruginosa]